jgi:HTH-type transcriptional regulator / antitoxin HigA
MVEMKLYKYEPDYAVKPGEILEENLETRNIKKADLALRCGLSAKTISQIITGIAPVSPETALCFQRVLGVSANIWNNLEANYRLFLTKQKVRKELAKFAEWAGKFPVKQLFERGVLEPKEDFSEVIEQLLDFFGVGSVEAWEAKYRELQVAFRCSPSFKSSRESVASWLRIGELCAQKVECEPYNRMRFMKVLQHIRTLTSEDPEIFEPRMRQICAGAGVALAFVNELPDTHLSGATRWIAKDKALIMLSLRHKRDDYFWFSFFHEAGHILLGRKRSIFLDEINSWADPEEELANEYASDILIPKEQYKAFLEDNVFTPTSVRSFAQKIQVTPGIVVGRLQHDEKVSWRSSLNNLTRRFELIEACNEN